MARATASRGPIELAVGWIHTDAPEAPGAIAEALAPGARFVQVFGTRVWPLERVPVHVVHRQVLLGSVDGPLAHARGDLRGRAVGGRR